MFNQKIWFITLFPDIVETYFNFGVLSKFKESLRTVNPAKYSDKGFKGVDSSPFGGGPGMVMRVDILAKTLREGVFKYYNNPKKELSVYYTGPEGLMWNHSDAKCMAECFSAKKQYSRDLVFICGRYEGVDQRFIDMFVDKTFSVGNFILSGGELPALLIVDSLLRFVPGVLGNPRSFKEDSFENNLMDYPKWTRPRCFEGVSVPDILLCGDHEKVNKFNNSQRHKL